MSQLLPCPAERPAFLPCSTPSMHAPETLSALGEGNARPVHRGRDPSLTAQAYSRKGGAWTVQIRLDPEPHVQAPVRGPHDHLHHRMYTEVSRRTDVVDAGKVIKVLALPGYVKGVNRHVDAQDDVMWDLEQPEGPLHSLERQKSARKRLKP